MPEARPTLIDLATAAADAEVTAATAGDAAAGLRCPWCGCRDFRVLYTRRHDGRIMRRRGCRLCGKRITTYERMAGDPRKRED